MLTQQQILSSEIPDVGDNFRKEYDFIVIGSGSGGSVMANRLTEISKISVLLIEAGGQESLVNQIPLTAAFTSITHYNWGYKTEPEKNACHGHTGGVCSWPKGKGIGGTSLVNFMVYNRGHRKDFDLWSKLGNYGWDYDNILPYFKKSEIIRIPELNNSLYHGHNGYMDVTYPPYKSQLVNAFLKTGYDLGYNISDPNGKNILGFSRIQANIRDGRRCSAGKAFIEPITNRKNLDISMNSMVVKLLINNKTKIVEGVALIKDKKLYVVRAKKEVILAAGVVGSPQLLMLSGIGPKEHLNELNISLIEDLKVGYNLQDHISLPGLTFLVNSDVTIVTSKIMRPSAIFQYLFRGEGIYTLPGGAEAYCFVRTENSTVDEDYSDLEIVLGNGGLNNDRVGALRNLLGLTKKFVQNTYSDIYGEHAFGLVPVLLNTKSRGRITLKNKNPFSSPKLVANYFQYPEEIETLTKGIRLAIKISESKHFKKFGTRFHRKPYYGCENEKFDSDSYWKCCIRRHAISLQHQVGTCKMGPKTDREAVVDSELKVYGIKNLRVVDASIIPVLPAAHTNSIALMIGEKGADMVKKSWNLL
ncbi:glucose dehydrogenase [FAD, quinone]-like [Condylostylus longicornis]|uniref:glucose dehydrogenase [FAD, quinone]-like n=1 Tax=Condylostylus longicornis TaxID=2530218 RepID=UPI00244DC2B6|nr:glucose dehydrogenase [FAD, quinone]-like [Condylostylus longicornis]